MTDAAPLLDRVDMLDITRETHTADESIERHIKTLDGRPFDPALRIPHPRYGWIIVG